MQLASGDVVSSARLHARETLIACKLEEASLKTPSCIPVCHRDRQGAASMCQVTIQPLLLHWLFYLVQRQHACAGVGLTDLGSEAMDIIKGLAGIVAAHYPERLYRRAPSAVIGTLEFASAGMQFSSGRISLLCKCSWMLSCFLSVYSCMPSMLLWVAASMHVFEGEGDVLGCWCRNFIVNAPGFFSLIWRVAEPMLSPTTRRKIRLLHNKQVLSCNRYSGACVTQAWCPSMPCCPGC